MDTFLLPSEIARLVLGYLQEQCEEAAKLFMEKSPFLNECRTVPQRGRKYYTKVGGLTLVDILDKYCMANAMVQEKLKGLDCEQMKHCNGLIEQLRYLLEGARGHRFVVNISVPPQNSPSGSYGSPNLSGSSRKRHHSSSERVKRISKSINTLSEKPSPNSTSQNCNTVEATPLASLPGHTISTRTNEKQNRVHPTKDTFTKPIFLVNTSKDNNFETNISNNPDQTLVISNLSNVNRNCKDQSTETLQSFTLVQEKTTCTAGTNTEELMNYVTTEVQTGPSDFLESGFDITNEPVQNLSIYTTELLQRTELHERIAENINKAILPVELSFREEHTYENTAETNVSKLSDLHNAFKSVVQATETDPAFKEFFQELFTVAETDTSLDEDSDQILINQNHLQTSEPMQIVELDNNLTGNAMHSQEFNESDLPIKQRLRNSSRSQTSNIDEEEKESNTLLDDQNAEAVANIVNVITKRNLLNNELNTNETPLEASLENLINNKQITNENNEVIKKSENTNRDIKSVKPAMKKNTKKSQTLKLKPQVETCNNESIPKVISEQEIMTTTTLIPCSEEEVQLLLPSQPKRMKSGYIPIAPKPEDPELLPRSTIYLRTVNVPHHMMNSTQIEASNSTLNPLWVQKSEGLQQPKISSQSNYTDSVVPVIVTNDGRAISIASAVPIVPVTTNEPSTITLYGSENNSCYSSEIKVSSLPVISIEEPSFGLTASSSLSPFIESNNAEEDNQESHENIQKVETQTNKIQANIQIINDMLISEPTVNASTSAAEKEERKENKQENAQSQKQSIISDVLITKHTPKSLLKSRSKNNRLSLSTPRRRNSHVRALDFSTPIKVSGSIKKMPQSCTKAYRSSLFRSPSNSGNDDTTTTSVNFTTKQNIVKKIKTLSPVIKSPITYQQVPIATRSPRPKLQGNWNKVGGIDLILGETSANESSPEKVVDDTPLSPLPSTSSQIVEEKVIVEKSLSKESCDSDLREIANSNIENQEESKLKIKKKENISSEKVEIKNCNTKMKKKENIKNKSEEINLDEHINSKSKTESDDKSIKNVTTESITSKKIKFSNPGSLPLVKKTIIIDPKKNPNYSKEYNLAPGSECCEMLDYKTPRKMEVTVLVPPTPQVIATPADSFKHSNRLKPRQDVTTQKCAQTLALPATPRVILTPKNVKEEEDIKRPSPYYEPGEDTLEAVKVKEVINTETIMVQKTTTKLTIERNIPEHQENQKIEITKLVATEKKDILEKSEEKLEGKVGDKVGDNREEVKEYEENPKQTTEEESIEEMNTSVNSEIDSDNESTSDSNSSTSSSSSSTTSSSSSTSSSSPESTSPTKSVQDPKTDTSTTESEIGYSEKNLSNNYQETINKIDTNEHSPKKVFPVIEKTIDELPKETPIKDDQIFIEANISETPSFSEAERALRRDSLTNLSSKISAIISTSQSDQTTETATIDIQPKESSVDQIPVTDLLMPKITNIEKTVPTDGMTLQVSKLLKSDIQKNAITLMPQNQSNLESLDKAKLCYQLEEKRQRVVAKFKQEVSNTRTGGQSRKVPVTGIDKVKNKNVQQNMKINKQTSNVEKVIAAKEEKAIKLRSSKIESKKNEDDPKEIKKCKSKVNSKKTLDQSVVNKIKTEYKSTQDVCTKEEKETLQNEVKATVAIRPVSIESAKGVLKIKVDQVKRDLFSEDENDQRTTRSQTVRRFIDNKKTEENRDANASVENSNEILPGVLECLQLMPANKSDNESSNISKNLNDTCGVSTSQTNGLEVSFTYDESVPIKKRKPCDETFQTAPKNIKLHSPKNSPVQKKRKKSDKNSKEALSSPMKTKSKKSKSSDKEERICKKKLKAKKNKTQVENKPKPDPQTLLNKIKIDEFLKSVHVSD